MHKTLRLFFNSPEALEDGIAEALAEAGDIDELEQEQFKAQAEAAANKWLRYGKYLTIEINLEDGTAAVLKP